MNRFYSIFLSFITLLVIPSCIVDQETNVQYDIEFQAGADPSVSVRSDGNVAVNFTESGGEAVVSFTVSTHWSADKGSASWCSISPLEGKSGSIQMKVQASRNSAGSPRETTVTLSCGALRRYIYISQDAARPPYLNLSESSLTFDCHAGNQSFSIESNTDWKATSSQSWCKVSPASGSGDGTVTVEVSDYSESTIRSATVTVATMQGMSKTVEIRQAGIDVFELTPSEVAIGCDGGDFTVKVTTSIGYKVSSMPEWISELTAGEDTRTHQFRATANESKESRSGVVVFCNDKEVCIPVTVEQEGKTPSLSLSASSMTFDNEGGEQTLNLTSNTTWAVSSSESWCQVSPAKGERDASLTIRVSAFSEKTVRTATLTFTAEDLTKTVEVLQKGVDVFEVTPAEINIGEEGGDFRLTVVSSLKYSLTTIPTWVRQSSAEGDVFSFHADANNSTSNRSGVLTFTNEKKTNLSITVKQDGMTPKLEVSRSELFFDGDGGSETASVSSNVGWTATSDQPWCTVSPASGTGNKELQVNVAANTAATSRTAVVTVSTTEGGLTRSFTVTQSGDEALTFDWSKEFYHRSLVFRFTATWCGYCPMMAASLKQAHEMYPDRFVSVNIHGNSSELIFSEYAALDERFGVTGYPSSYMDYRQKIANYDAEYYCYLLERYLQEQERQYPAVSTAALKSSLSGNKLDVDVSLFIKEADKYKVTVYLTESGIIKSQADHVEGNHRNYIHDDVVRMTLTNVLGDDFTVSSANTRLKRSYSVTIPSGYQKDKLKILVFVQRAFGSQQRIQADDYGDYYVDNCIYGDVGKSLPPAIKTEKGSGNEHVTNGKPVNW